MDNNKKQASTMNFDHVFGPKDPSSTSSSSSSIFGSIFPPPATVGGRDPRRQEVRGQNFGAPDNHVSRGESSGRISNKNNNTSTANYQNESVVEPTYFCSSIYYGGQENYSPTTSRTTQPHHVATFKKDKTDSDEPNDNASRGNWWQGSLYY